jgi:SNF2 family DNA or RNA helicase
MTYSNILATRLKESQELEEKRKKTAAEKSKAQNASLSSSTRSLPTRRAKGKKRVAEDDDQDENQEVKAEDHVQPSTTLTQPPLITVPLREYQLQGVQWSACLSMGNIFLLTDGINPVKCLPCMKMA